MAKKIIQVLCLNSLFPFYIMEAYVGILVMFHAEVYYES